MPLDAPPAPPLLDRGPYTDSCNAYKCTDEELLERRKRVALNKAKARHFAIEAAEYAGRAAHNAEAALKYLLCLERAEPVGQQ